MLDMIESNKNTIILKYALKEINSEINKLKENNIELRRKNCELAASLLEINAKNNKINETDDTVHFGILFAFTVICAGYMYYYI